MNEIVYRGLTQTYRVGFGDGIQFWTDSKEAAKEYATPKWRMEGDESFHVPVVVAARLVMKHPFIVSNANDAVTLAEHIGIRWLPQMGYWSLVTVNIKSVLYRHGYDGLMLAPDESGAMNHRTFVTLEHRQVRLEPDSPTAPSSPSFCRVAE
jgi:hypothetical protein